MGSHAERGNQGWLQPTLAAILFFALTALNAVSFGDEPAPPPQRAPREIYVPFADLHVLLERQPQRVLLGRAEYDDLVKKAKWAPKTHAPLPAATIAADYAVTLERENAEIHGLLTIDVLEGGLHALPLDIGGVGLASAKLDGRAAPLGRDDAGQLVLFVEGLGRHELALEMVARLDTTAARQVLSFRLPRPPTAKLRLTAPGDVEIKEGADVVSRVVGQVANLSHPATTTRFELLPRQGDTTLVMTLNSHFQRHERLVMARSVLVDEVTAAYEELHATVSLEILHQAVDQFRFVVPEGFEIAEVASPLLAYWDVRQESGRRLLGVKLREQTTETVELRIAAIRAPARLERWYAPRLELLDVVGSVTVLGLLVEDRLNVEAFKSEGLIPVDVSVLGKAWGDAPQLRPAAAWYAPQGNYALAAHYRKPPAELAVTTSLVLILADKGQEVRGELALVPQVEKRFSFDVSVPAGWQVTSVTTANGRPLPFDRYSPLPVEEGRNISPLPVEEGPGVRASRVADSPHPNPNTVEIGASHSLLLS